MQVQALRMSNNQKIKISKLEAAKRQLSTAISLWLRSDDPVSIHTLTTAALRILYDLGKKQGLAATLYDLPGVYEYKKRELRQLFNRPENFFKHADEDPTDVLDFNPDSTEMYMLDAVCLYEKLSGQLHLIFSCFKAWMFINNPDAIDDKAAADEIKARGISAQGMSRIEFFDLWMKVTVSVARDG